jgi:hypothetical protein
LATLPSALAERCIKAGWPKQICACCEAPSGCGTICEVFGTEPGVAFDPLGGAGTVSLVAEQLGLRSVMIELNPKYADIAERRITGDLVSSIEKDEGRSVRLLLDLDSGFLRCGNEGQAGSFR